jgi:hypothetical protein
MKRVRKYTYLPQEEIEVIETKSGQTIKSKEILDGNYVKAKPAPKKVVKKAVKRKYAKGGKLVGKQKKLDVNKNGKLDAEDFKMLRGEKMAKGGKVDFDKVKTKYATQDINLLQKEGAMAITDTKKGVLFGEHKGGVFSFTTKDGKNIFSGNKQEAIEFVKDNYQVEQMADGGMIVKDWQLKSNGRYYATFFLMKDDPRYRLITEHGVTESIEDVNGGYELTISVTKEGKDFFENYEGLDTNGNPYTFKTMAKGEESILVYYVNHYPEDELGLEIKAKATFKGLNEVLDNKKDVYSYIGVGDSLVRERVFIRLAQINRVDYDVIYKKWLEADEYAKGGYMAKGGKTPIVRTQFEEEEFEYAKGGMMAKGGYTSKGELVWRKLSASKKNEFLYENFTPQITPRGQEILVGKDFQFLPKNVKIKLQEKYANVEEYADGGKVTDKEVAESNVHMLQSNIKSIKHHAEELESAIKDNTEVEGWVLAKADRAATAMSDITHYIDGRKLGTGGMVGGIYYKDKSGNDLRFIGPDSRNDDMGIFKDGEKYVTKPLSDFDTEKEKKSFWFGNGGFMPSGFSRKVSLSEKAEEMVGKNTWHILDAAQKGEVIGELISDGALAVTMDRGGIIDADDWSKSMTQDKIYALKKAGYSENIASEMSLLPYEQLPMWVRQDFKKASIVIGAYHIHNNANTSGLMSDDNIPIDGKVLVLDGEGIVVFYADTLEQAKDWAYHEIQHQKEMDDEFADEDERVGERDYADGGVTEVTKFKVVYKLKDAAEPKEKLFDNAEKAEFFLETIQEDDDIESANLVEVKPMKKAAEKKAPTNLFAAAKPAAASSASKKTKEDVLVPGIADRIARYDALKAIIKNAEAEKEVIGGSLKEVGKEKFLELYELRRRNPETFNLADEDEKIMFIVMDKYIKVEPEKAGMLENYPGLLETTTTYKFNPALLDRTGEIISRLIMESTELSDDEKANLIVAETKIGIKSGSIDRLMDYDNPAQIFDLIEPILALK